MRDVDAEEAVRDEVLRGGEGHALVAADGGARQQRGVLALDEADANAGLARALPGDTGLGVHALRDVDQPGQVVLPSGIDGLLRRLESVRVPAQVGRTPRGGGP